MKSIQIQAFIALCIFSSFIAAVPVVLPALDARAAEAQSYSVVPVDGGSSATAAPAAAKTVTDAVTVSQVQTSVVLSTVTATPSNAAPTAQVVSQTITTTIVQTPSPATVTKQPPVTSIPYDDGQWHTIYYFTSTISASAEAAGLASVTNSPVASSSTVSKAALPTTSIDPGQWAAWANKGTGQWQGPQPSGQKP